VCQARDVITNTVSSKRSHGTCRDSAAEIAAVRYRGCFAMSIYDSYRRRSASSRPLRRSSFATQPSSPNGQGVGRHGPQDRPRRQVAGVTHVEIYTQATATTNPRTSHQKTFRPPPTPRGWLGRGLVLLCHWAPAPLYLHIADSWMDWRESMVQTGALQRHGLLLAFFSLTNACRLV